jgi:hypothetical protein
MKPTKKSASKFVKEFRLDKPGSAFWNCLLMIFNLFFSLLRIAFSRRRP